MWKNLILEIEKIEKSFNDKLNTPATDSEVKKLRERMKKSFNVDLPSEYEEFLKTVNGLDFNGLVLYGVDSYLLDTERDKSICGLIETNEIWYENEFQKEYLFLGDSNIAWFCKNLSDGTYLELDKPSGTVMNTYNDCNTMLEEALKTALL
ncbi:SMI1/KNR4 family protein [Bacillus wiedmannii]|uniref:SMI1 / KNR4 family protein n=1 Tax=Bacillus wiedmannii TaxID=1890302 RepID=A0A2C4NUP8_9BACI|nr:YrhA family protein [Bacillus wiedmannii]KPU55130.1 SMI1-KNR4 cell-wall family protein [Bacillus wiedmannii]MED3124449.1 YrhA family protein [Bacillus wiedmannii]OTX88347.1 SMI1 / KNR4 family protein [Bacillus wiedmannii]PEJ47384.1 SMI1/KNR4 family protein [Bacillus wiedmannii]PEP04163.1 SMI1/KNR4 family protein [Bacillus wiedmannii]